MMKIFPLVVVTVAAIGSVAPVYADQAATDLQAVLDAQQQQQQANLVAGLSGVQPYCMTYGSCPAAPSFPSNFDQPSGLNQRYPGNAVDLGTILASLFGQAPQPVAAPPETMPPNIHHRHRRRHHLDQYTR